MSAASPRTEQDGGFGALSGAGYSFGRSDFDAIEVLGERFRQGRGRGGYGYGVRYNLRLPLGLDAGLFATFGAGLFGLKLSDQTRGAGFEVVTGFEKGQGGRLFERLDFSARRCSVGTARRSGGSTGAVTAGLGWRI